MNSSVVIPRVWRSELTTLAVFVVMSVLSYFMTSWFPSSIIKGELIGWGGTSLVLHLPLFWFIPAATLGRALYRIYNVRYTVDSQGIEGRIGILSTRQRITRVRYEDIRSVETEQTITERMLDIGQVEIGTAATGAIEIIFSGIAAPKEVQDMIQAERDRRQKIARQPRNNTAPADRQAAASGA